MKSVGALRKSAGELLREYTDPAMDFAFRTYDSLYGRTYVRSIEPSDVLMAKLMSLPLEWGDVIPMFAVGDGKPQSLRVALDRALVDLAGVPSFEDHESVEHLERSVVSLAAANQATEGVPNWTPVTVSKVLHRHRPHIVPVCDSRVRDFYGISKGKKSWPSELRAALFADARENKGWLTDLAAGFSTPDRRPLTVLRAMDIMIWMSQRTK